MKKKLYYVVEKQTNNENELSGEKLITVYEIVDNEPKCLTTLEVLNEENTDACIEIYLTELGHNIEFFELKLL